MADYYLDSSVAISGDGSEGSPWKLPSNVNWGPISAALGSGNVNFNLARGSVWNAALYVNRTDVTTNLLTLQPVGDGLPPCFTGIANTDVAGSWSQDDAVGNPGLWKYDTTSNKYIDVIAFGGTYSNNGANFYGGIWGQLVVNKVSVVANYQFYYDGANHMLYVYSSDDGGITGTNPITKYGGVYPIAVGGSTGYLLSSYTKSYIRFKGIKCVNFSGNGIYLGSGDVIQVDYCQFDSGVIGPSTIYGINCANNAAADVKIYNNGLIRCYYGAKTGSGAYVFRNNRILFNQSTGIYGGGVGTDVDYNHIYGNGISYLNDYPYLGSVTWGANNKGALQGGGSIWTNTAKPNYKDSELYPPKVSIVIDDVDSNSLGTDALTDADVASVDLILSAFESRSMSCGLGVKAQAINHMANFPAKLLSWYNNGHDIISHSYSHNYWSLPAIMSIRYLVAEACTMTIVGNLLTTDCATPANNLSIDLTVVPGDSDNTIDGLAAYITAFNGGGKYSAAFISTYAPVASKYTHAKTLADVTAVDIRTAVYKACTDKAKVVQDEMAASKSVIESVIGAGNCLGYIFPGTITDSTTMAYANSAGFTGCRGINSLQSGQVATAVVANGGSGYAVGDYLTITGGGTFSLFQVATLAGDAVATVDILYDGATCVAGVNNTVALTGSGTGCTLTLTITSEPTVKSLSVGGIVGVDAMNLPGHFLPTYFSGQSESFLKGVGQSIMYKSMIWGMPFILWLHPQQMTTTEMGALLDGIKSVGSLTNLSDTGSYLAGLTPLDGVTAYLSGTTKIPDWTTLPGDACINQGNNVSLSEDINGNHVPIGTTDIGEYEVMSSSQIGLNLSLSGGGGRMIPPRRRRR